MKQNLVIVIAICILFGFEASSQSFTLGAPGNIVINNGDTITVAGTTNDFDLFGHLGLTNYSSSVKSVMILKEELSLVPFCDVTFQFGIWMYPPMVYTTPQGFDVAAGATDSSFHTAYTHYGNAGTSFVKYTFFDENNPLDKAWMVFKFEITQATNIGESAGLQGLNIYPNPAGDFVTIQNRFAEPVLYTIVDAVGVRIRQLTSQSQETKIDLGDLPGGCYFIFAQTKNADSREVYKVIKQ
jgi:Secretion system C-terminal sorting domain